MKYLYKTFLLFTIILASFSAKAQEVKVADVATRFTDNFLTVDADIVLDSLRLPRNSQILITPVVRRDSLRAEFPSLLVSGRNMHVVYERGALGSAGVVKNRDIVGEIERKNGSRQTMKYSGARHLEEWMRSGETRLEFVYDECGCGSVYGTVVSDIYNVFHNPVKEMKSVMITPAVTELPITKHEGRARVQFEVNKTELHVDPYICKNGQRIDNRSQIKIIDDSVKYALEDPNVELAGIRIIGYASPESPYIHNEQLASGRSLALAEYLEERYSLPKGSAEYAAVAENWGEFRTEVEKSDEITEKQRAELLQLIDLPAYTPEDFDRKEKILKTDPRFAKLYKTKILPEWFPRLRATTFQILTRLKPMSDEKLAEVIETTPEKMSLNQMFRVARLYPEGSDDYNRVIRKALEYYPDDNTALINAASAYIEKGDYAKAKEVIANAAESPEVYNILGIIATAEEDFNLAKEYFSKAGNNPDARVNLELLK